VLAPMLRSDTYCTDARGMRCLPTITIPWPYDLCRLSNKIL